MHTTFSACIRAMNWSSSRSSFKAVLPSFDMVIVSASQSSRSPKKPFIAARKGIRRCKCYRLDIAWYKHFKYKIGERLEIFYVKYQSWSSSPAA